MCTRSVTTPPICSFAAGVSCAKSCIENVKANDRYAECLEVSVNFAFARDAAIIIPVVLYARLLMRVASRRKVRPASRLTLGKNHVSAFQHPKQVSLMFPFFSISTAHQAGRSAAEEGDVHLQIGEGPDHGHPEIAPRHYR